MLPKILYTNQAIFYGCRLSQIPIAILKEESSLLMQAAAQGLSGQL
jgi:hypothetical protein